MSIEFALQKVRSGLGTDLNHYISSFATDMLMTQKIAYDGSNRTEYIGFALPGTASSAPGWLIKKMTYGAAGATDIQFAGGAIAFTSIWDSRAGYSYS